MAGAEVSRRQFLAKAGLAGSVAAAAQLGMLARAAPATAGGAISPPTPTVPPIAARRAVKRLLTPLPPWIRTGPTNKARVAITIDDMWGTFGADNANAAMDVAKAKGVKLSFFPTGGALEEHIRLGRQATWQRAVAEGHDIGNHTYTHTEPDQAHRRPDPLRDATHQGPARRSASARCPTRCVSCDHPVAPAASSPAAIHAS